MNVTGPCGEEHPLVKASFATPDGVLHLWVEFRDASYLPWCLLDDYLRSGPTHTHASQFLQPADAAVHAPPTCILCLGAT